MILFDLQCDSGHGFEAWFPDSNAYESQRRKGIIECPECGETKVEKALMAPAVTTSRKAAARDEKVSFAMAKQVLSEMRKQIEENCDYVGGEFAEEARKIHYGEVESRNIYGQATNQEAEELQEEGVEFGALPWLDHAKN